MPNGISNIATISCHEGFYIKHPNNLVGFARGQYSVLDGEFMITFIMGEVARQLNLNEEQRRVL